MTFNPRMNHDWSPTHTGHDHGPERLVRAIAKWVDPNAALVLSLAVCVSSPAQDAAVTGYPHVAVVIGTPVMAVL